MATRKKELTLEHRLAALPPLPQPPPPPETLTEVGKECWRSLGGELKDYRDADYHLLLNACHWQEAFTQAVVDARDATEPGEQWKHETKMSMCSKQFLASVKALGILQKRRARPDRMARLRAIELGMED